MSFAVPQPLREGVVKEFGQEGARWLSRLPELVESLLQEWSLHLVRVIETGSWISWIGVVEQRGGQTAVLKVGHPHDEARYEADALIALDGRGAVRVLRRDAGRFALLLERCQPGHDLWSLPEDEGNAVAADLLARLWRPPPAGPFEPLAGLAARWASEFPVEHVADGYDEALAERASALALELAGSQPELVLLHGDYHPYNVLAAQREPWLVIDPKPLVGERAYDLAQFLHNRAGDARKTGDAVSHLRRQVEDFAVRLGLDAERVAGWAFVKSFGWTWGPDETREWAQVARI